MNHDLRQEFPILASAVVDLIVSEAPNLSTARAQLKQLAADNSSCSDTVTAIDNNNSNNNNTNNNDDDDDGDDDEVAQYGDDVSELATAVALADDSLPSGSLLRRSLAASLDSSASKCVCFVALRCNLLD